MKDIEYTLTGCMVLIIGIGIAIIPVSLMVYAIGMLIETLLGG